MSEQKPPPPKEDEDVIEFLESEFARTQRMVANDNQKEWSLEPFPDGWYADC